MITEKIDSVTKTLRGLGGQVDPKVYEVLRFACAELDDAKASATRLEDAVLIITDQVKHLDIQ